MTHGTGSRRNIAVQGLSRVEGEGSLHVTVRDGVVGDVALDIFEPPRYFEALLVGRHFTEAPDITARICGICPVAYQLTACAAMEDLCDVTVSPAVTDLRRLLYCGEWIQSHALHVYLLHAPDFLGCADAVELAERERAALQRGLELKRTGNLIMQTIGGRAIHPVNVRVGGFFHAPDPEAIAALREPVRRALDLAVTTVAWAAGFDFPDEHGNYDFVALHRDDQYAIDAGDARSTSGLRVDPAHLAGLIVEEHVAGSTALHARLAGRDHYLTGPLARYAHNLKQLPPRAARAARDASLGDECRNPFRSIVVRAVELVAACEEALRLVDHYVAPYPPAEEIPVRAGVGVGATEAPRGLLVHEYEVDDHGTILRARIIPPTSQNQATIEDDLRRVVEHGLDLPDEELRARCEQSVRNHDPCISCAAHFLDLEVHR